MYAIITLDKHHRAEGVQWPPLKNAVVIAPHTILGVKHPHNGGSWHNFTAPRDASRIWMVVAPKGTIRTRFADAVHFSTAEIISVGTGQEILTELGWHLADPEWACKYADHILKGPFPQGEAIIASVARTAFRYALLVIKAPWPAGEAAIATDPQYAYRYAVNVIKGPWPPGEAAIATCSMWASLYAELVLKKPWPQGEAAIATSPINAYHYARDVLKGPFPLGEPAILSSKKWAHDYKEFLKGNP